jgi:peptidoglycan/LPS O-acetylase OafA/YrhL
MSEAENTVKHKSDYIFGLDIMRALAILFVLVGHTLEHSQIYEWIKPIGRFAVIGVEIFFVLSGFLIGTIIVRLIEKGRFGTMKDISTFWKRRWLRTIPLYVIALLAFLNFDYHGKHDLSFHPEYWLFMQNFAWSIPDDFFTISWSLAIEEHFYLWFPLVFLAAYTFSSKRIAFYLSALFLLAVAIGYRLHLPHMDYNAWNWESRMVVLARLDSIMFGVLMAYINFYHAAFWDRIRSLSVLWFALIAGLFVWYYLGAAGITERWVQVFGVTLHGLLLALLLPYFNNIRREPSGYVEKAAAWTSKLAYSLYLGHIICIIFVVKLLSALGIYNFVYPKPYLLYPVLFTAYYFLAFTTYSYVEKPFLDLRDGVISGKMMKKFVPFGILFLLLIADIVL